jgi:hypothetical protein
MSTVNDQLARALAFRAERGGVDGIWTWPIAGGQPRLLLEAGDPQRHAPMGETAYLIVTCP